MKKKTLLLCCLFMAAPLSYAAYSNDYSGPVGTEAGWQTDTDGSVTTVAGTRFLWLNEANFPDETLRLILMYDNHNESISSSTNFNNYSNYSNVNRIGKDNVLTESEVNSVKGINCGWGTSTRGIQYINSQYSLTATKVSDLTGINYFTNLLTLFCSGNDLTDVDVSNLNNLISLSIANGKISSAGLVLPNTKTNLKRLVCNGSAGNGAHTNLTSLDVSEYVNLEVLSCYFSSIPSLDLTNNKQLKSLSCQSTNITSLDLSKNTKLESLNAGQSSNYITSLTMPTTTTLKTFSVSYTTLSSFDLSLYTNLETIEMSRWNNLPTVTMPPTATSLTRISIVNCSSLESLDLSMCTNAMNISLSQNNLSSSSLKLPTTATSLNYLNIQDNELTSLDVSAYTALKGLVCGYNYLTELNLSTLTGKISSSCTLGSQYPAIDLVTYSTTNNANGHKHRNKIAIKCQTNNGKLSNYSADYDKIISAETYSGNNYMILNSDATGDIDWHNQQVMYDYTTDFAGSGSENSVMYLRSVTGRILTTAYVMYLNPKAQDTGESSYYGTLYVDYPVHIPEGVEAYYASALDAEEETLTMTRIPDGKVIPAYTAIYVKATDGSGYYPFYDAEMHKDGVTSNPKAATISGKGDVFDIDPSDLATIGTNYLTGVLTATTVTPKRIFTLGHDRSSKLMGFWNFTGNTIPAHRAYVSEETLIANGILTATSGEAKGLAMIFQDDFGVTAVKGIDNFQSTMDNWYSVDGRKLGVKPTEKGLYIHNGKKVIIK